MRKSNLFLIPPNWTEMVLELLCIMFVGVLIVLGVDPPYPKISPWEMEGVLLLFLCRSLICYELRDTHLTVKFLVVPIRRVPWEKVCSAVYIPPRSNRHGLNRGTCVVLSTRVGKHFHRMKTSQVLLRNPFATVKIRLDYQDDSCLQAITQYVDLQE